MTNWRTPVQTNMNSFLLVQDASILVIYHGRVLLHLQHGFSVHKLLSLSDAECNHKRYTLASSVRMQSAHVECWFFERLMTEEFDAVFVHVWHQITDQQYNAVRVYLISQIAQRINIHH